MIEGRSSTVDRTAASFALAALLLVLVGSTGAFAADAGVTGERCVGCLGCEDGDCEGHDGDSSKAHHHCCTMCCMSHASFALPALPSSAGPALVESTPACALTCLADRSAEAPYRPPRT